jgi:chemosensory pili system protein ChpA (sensor histidine kinase/response regulator)
MMRHVWDLLPEGGGRPIKMQLHATDVSEAIERHPERYSLFAPEGTVEHEIEQRKQARATEIAKIAQAEQEALAKIATDKQAKIDAIRKEQADAAKAEAERVAAEQAKAEGPVAVNRQGEINQIEAEAADAAARVRIDAERERDKLAKTPDHEIALAPKPEIVPERSESEKGSG